VVDSLQEMREHINQRLTEIHKKGLKRVVFYGAGEVMEVALPLAETAGLNVVGLVDDDPNKHGGRRGGMTVRPPGSIRDLGADAILITTFRHTSEISGRIDACLQSRIQVLKL
jgi:FlaA1/EpsC-like NDP-sugar epimerase